MKKLVLAAVALALLSGCATVKRVTGQTNDTILPGQREEILPPDQQTARDPAVTGQQPGAVPGQQPIAQSPVYGAQPAMPGAPKPGAPLAMPSQGAAASAATCDPKVDLCPEPMSPDPLPPPSPLKPLKVAGDAAKSGVLIDPKTGKPMAGTKPTKLVPAIDPKTGQPVIDPKTGKPVMVAAQPMKKKIVKKKKPVKPAAPATGDAATPPAAPDAPAVPAPPQPQAQ